MSPFGISVHKMKYYEEDSEANRQPVRANYALVLAWLRDE